MAVAKPLPMRHLPWLLVDDEDGTDVFTDGSEPLLIVQDLSNPQPKLLVLGVSCAQRLDLYDHLRGTRPPGNIEGSGIAVPRPENFVTRFLSEIRKLVLKHSVRDGRYGVVSASLALVGVPPEARLCGRLFALPTPVLSREVARCGVPPSREA